MQVVLLRPVRSIGEESHSHLSGHIPTATIMDAAAGRKDELTRT